MLRRLKKQFCFFLEIQQFSTSIGWNLEPQKLSAIAENSWGTIIPKN
jgi:hypothetical protein